MESEEIRIGQVAEVHFDAFPDLVLKGRVYSIGALAVSGWRQNYFIRSIPVNIALQSRDPRLIPDLSASGNIEMESRSDALAVPQEAVFGDTGKPFVFVKLGDHFQKRQVNLGPRNNTQVAVLSGLRRAKRSHCSAPRRINSDPGPPLVAALAAILQALRRAVRRDLGTFRSLKLNNFFLFIALLIWGALESGVEPKSAEPLLLLLFLVLLFPLSSDRCRRFQRSVWRRGR